MERIGDVTGGEPLGASGARPIYSIGAVAKMLGVDAATLRAWEERYELIVPERTKGAQRVYSRDHVEHLRFVVAAMQRGETAADAHRLLAEHLRSPNAVVRFDHVDKAVTVVILLAERDRYAAELCEYFLRTEGYDVDLAFDPASARRLFVERNPDLSVVELMISGGGLELCRALTSDSTAPLLAVSALNLADEAIAAGASAFLSKPLEPLQFVSTVRDLLGSSALTRRDARIASS
jgi:DNA-binding transcriptional MerR regulator